MTKIPEQLQRRWRALPPVPRIILVTIAVIFLLYLFRPSAPVIPEQDNSPRVSVLNAQVGSFTPQLLLFGHIQSPASATLSSSVNAVVQSLPVLAGSQVTQGQQLVLLDTREAELAQAQAQAALDSARARKQATVKRFESDRKALALEQKLTGLAEQNLKRIEQLRTDQLASQTQVDDARQNLTRQQLSLESRQLAVQNHSAELRELDAEISRASAAADQANLDLERSEVRAPADGRVTTLHVAPGERVRPGDPLVSLYADQGVEIRAQIPQRYLPEIRMALEQGQQLTGTLFLEQRTSPLVLKRLAGEVQQGQGGVDGLFLLNDPAQSPELGRPLELTLSLPSRDQLVALPSSALHGLDRIYTIDRDNRLSAIQVTRAGEWRDADGQRLMLVKGNIAPGMPLMTTQLPGAIDGMKVQPVANGSTPTAAPALPESAAMAEPAAT